MQISKRIYISTFPNFLQYAGAVMISKFSIVNADIKIRQYSHAGEYVGEVGATASKNVSKGRWYTMHAYNILAKTVMPSVT
jgi:hypothetical protein